MIPAKRQFLLGAFLLTGRSGAFYAPTTSSLSEHLQELQLRTIAGSSRGTSLPRRRSRGWKSTRMMSSMQKTIEKRLTEALSPVHLEVINESHMHSGPATESHFKVVIVSEQFEGKPLLARHRIVNELFSEEMKGMVHALSIQGKTPSQWEAEGHKVIPSPRCMGGSKTDTSMLFSSALGADRRGLGRLRRGARHISNRAEAVALTALILVCALWRLCPGAAMAAAASAGEGARTAMTNSATRMSLSESVDVAFMMFVESLSRVLELESPFPLDQAAVMFSAAWVTTSVAPVAAAGLLGQPLGRAMVATATCHASYATYKFFLAVVALLGFQIPDSQMSQPAGTTRDGVASTPSKSKAAKAMVKPKMTPPPRFFKPVERSRRRARGSHGVVKGTVQGTPRTSVAYARRVSPTMMPRMWLMLVTAMGGPAIGAVSAVVAYWKGHTVLMAAFSSLIRGSVLGTFAAGTLCFGAAGSGFVMKWAVLQGIVGAVFASLLSPSVLVILTIYMYYKGLRVRGVAMGGSNAADGRAQEVKGDDAEGQEKSDGRAESDEDDKAG